MQRMFLQALYYHPWNHHRPAITPNEHNPVKVHFEWPPTETLPHCRNKALPTPGVPRCFSSLAYSFTNSFNFDANSYTHQFFTCIRGSANGSSSAVTGFDSVETA